MKPYSSSCANASRPRKDEPNFVNEWQLSIHWPMLAGGKDDAHAIGAYARISSICAAVRLSTICMSWLGLCKALLSFKVRLGFFTDALAPTNKLRVANPRGQP